MVEISIRHLCALFEGDSEAKQAHQQLVLLYRSYRNNLRFLVKDFDFLCILFFVANIYMHLLVFVRSTGEGRDNSRGDELISTTVYEQLL